MIKEFEFYHGIIFARILHATQSEIKIKPYPSQDNASYVINNEIGIYIKYSSKRMTPWSFTFKKVHQEEIEMMKINLKEVFLLLVCNDDGIVCISYSELNQILDNYHDPIEWITVKRQKREMYSISGSNGKLGFKIGINDFPAKLFDKNHPGVIKSYVENSIVLENDQI